MKEPPPTGLNATLTEALALLERLDVEVRNVHLGGTGGGFCVLRGKRVMFLDLDADVATQLDVSLAALAELPEVDSLFASPALRELLDRRRGPA